MRKRPTSANDTTAKHPYLVPGNWLPGGPCRFWKDNPELDAWAESIQPKRAMENFLPKKTKYDK